MDGDGGRPLLGKRVLVTRAAEQAGTLARLLEEHGAVPVEVPTVQIEPPSDPEPFNKALRRLDQYDWAVFTSANGVKAFLGKLSGSGAGLEGLKGLKLAAVGPATAAELKRAGLQLDYLPDEYVAEAIVQGLLALGVKDKWILVPRAEVAREVLPDELRKAGAVVDDVAAYRNVPAADLGGRLKKILGSGDLDVATFTSSSTVRNLVVALGGEEGTGHGARLLDATVNACIGPVTAKTAQELGVRVDVVARESTMRGLVEAIVDYFNSR